MSEKVKPQHLINALIPADAKAALDAYVAAEVRKALERAKARIGGYYSASGEPCHDIEVGERLAMENAIEIIDAMIHDAPSPDPG